MRKKRTVADFCNKILRSLVRDLKYAIVWGSSVKIQPQKVGKHDLNDEDVSKLLKNINIIINLSIYLFLLG